MDPKTMEGMLKVLIQGIETIDEAMQIALMHYQDMIAEEHLTDSKGGDNND